MADTATPELLDEWMIVELLGHRRLAARVREVQIAGAGMLRLDIPAATAPLMRQTQYVNPSSVYALHPVTEEVCRAVAGRYQPDPVHRWELPAAEPVDGDLEDAAAVEETHVDEEPF